MTQDPSIAPQSPEAAMSPRFHPPHATTSPRAEELAAPDPGLLAAVAGKSVSATADQLRQQAAELSQQLHARQRDLARREASLNARSADYDDQQRTARFWLQEQQLELDTRTAELHQQLAKIEQRAAECEAAGQASQELRCERERLRLFEQTVTHQQHQLNLQLENVQRQAACLETTRNTWQQQCQEEYRALHQLREQLLAQRQVTEQLNERLRERLTQCQQDEKDSDRLAAQRRELAAQATELRIDRAALDTERHALEREQEMWQARTQRQRQSIAARCRHKRRALQLQLDALQHRRQLVNRQQETLDQQEKDLDRQQRENMQTRLILQQTEARWEQKLSPEHFARLSHSVRLYVQAEIAAAEQALTDRKQELHELAATLQSQQETLKSRHVRQRVFLTQRQQELNDLAAQLAEREQELDQREHRLLDAPSSRRPSQHP